MACLGHGRGDGLRGGGGTRLDFESIEVRTVALVLSMTCPHVGVCLCFLGREVRKGADTSREVSVGTPCSELAPSLHAVTFLQCKSAPRPPWLLISVKVEARQASQRLGDVPVALTPPASPTRLGCPSSSWQFPAPPEGRAYVSAPLPFPLRGMPFAEGRRVRPVSSRRPLRQAARLPLAPSCLGPVFSLILVDRLRHGIARYCLSCLYFISFLPTPLLVGPELCLLSHP